MPKRILLVDDDQRFRSVFALAAGKLSAELVQSNSLKEAQSNLDTGNFDLLVIDRLLPDGDGGKWLAGLRLLGIETPALLISGHLQDSARFKFISAELGDCFLLQKPISIDSLCDLLKTGLANSATDSIDEEDYSGAFARLKSDYAAELSLRLNEIYGDIESCKPERIDQAIKQAHMLGGTAGIFGFSELGSSMKTVEDLLCFSLESPEQMKLFISIACRKLKAAIESLEKLSSPDNEPQRSKQSLFSASSSKVILVSSDSRFSQKIKSLLVAEGMIVYAFNDTQYLINILEEIEPDIVLLDCSGEDSSKIDICRLLTRGQKKLGLVIIGLVQASEMRSKLLNAGIARVLDKNTDNLELLAAIKGIECSACRALPGG